MDGEQGNAVAIVAEVVGIRSRQATSDGSEVVQFGYIQFEAFLCEESGISRILEKVGAVIALGSGVGRDIGAQDVGTGGVVCGHGEVRIGPGPQPAAAMMRIGTKPVNGEVFVAEGKLADVLIYKPGGGGVCEAF